MHYKLVDEIVLYYDAQSKKHQMADMCSSHLDTGNGVARIFKVGRFLSGLTKSHVLLWTALIASL